MKKTIFLLVALLSLCACAAPAPAVLPTPQPQVSASAEPEAPAADEPSGLSANGGVLLPHKPREFTDEEKSEILRYTDYVEFKDFALPLIGGGEISKSDILGKITVVNVMASWCKYCVLEMPYLAEAAGMYPSEDVAFLGVQAFEYDYTAGTELLKQLLDENGIGFTVAQDEKDAVGGFMSPRGSIPVTMVLDRDGYVRYTIPGALPDSQTLTSLIDFLLQFGDELPKQRD